MRHQRALSLTTTATGEVEVSLCAVIQDQNKSTTNTAESICDEALVKTCSDSLLGSDLLQAIHCALVDVLLWRLLGLHLQASADSVEWIAHTSPAMIAVCAAAKVEKKPRTPLS